MLGKESSWAKDFMLLVGHRRLIDQQDAAASDVASFRPDDVGTPPFGRAPVPRPGPAAAPSGLLQRPAPLGPPSRRFLRRPCGRRPAHRLLPHGLRNRSVYRVVPSCTEFLGRDGGTIRRGPTDAVEPIDDMLCCPIADMESVVEERAPVHFDVALLHGVPAPQVDSSF